MHEGARIRLGRVLLGSRSNGPGLRDVFWVTGCPILCPGCINPHFLDPRAGEAVELEALEEMIGRRRNEVEGITLSGGEPTEQAEATGRVAAHAQELGLSVVLFTGRTLSACRRRSDCSLLLGACDLVVAGPYVASLWRPHQPLLGSANQIIHFLSGRYGPEDLEGSPRFELNLTSRQITWTGFRHE